MHIVHESGISLLSAILTLGNTGVYVGFTDCSDMASNIEASID